MAYSWPGAKVCEHSESAARVMLWYMSIWYPPLPGYEEP
jgi:hypothetical protein